MSRSTPRHRATRRGKGLRHTLENRGALANPVVRNGYALVLTMVVTSAAGVLFWAVAARVSSPEEVGRAAAAITVLTLTANIAGLNLTGSLSYLLPRQEGSVRRYVTWSYIGTATLATIVGLAFLVSIHVFSIGSLAFLVSDPVLAVVFVLAAPAFVLFTVQDGVLVGLRRSTWVLIENSAFSLAKLVVLVVLALLGVANGILYSWVGAMLLTLPVISLLIFRVLIVEVSKRPDTLQMTAAAIRRFVGLQYASSLVGHVYMNVLPLVVLVYLGTAANGLFYVPWTIAVTIDLVSHSLGASLTVESAAAPRELSQHLRAIGRRLATLLGAGAVMTVAAAPLVLGIYGAAYAESGSLLLRLLVLGALCRAVVIIAQSATRALGENRLTMVTEGAICVLVLGMSIALLPDLGIDAVGWSWLIGNGLVAAATLPRLLSMTRRPADDLVAAHR